MVTPQYEATTRLYLSPVAGQEMKLDKVVDNENDQLRNRHVYQQTQLRVLQSRTLLETVMSAFNDLGQDQLVPDTDGVKELREMMSATPQQGTELLAISVRSSDPSTSSILANLIAEVYKAHTLDAHRGSARGAQLWIEEQLDQWHLRIAEANDAQLDFQRKEGVYSPESRTTVLSARSEALKMAFGAANTERGLLATMPRMGPPPVFALG
ncbi:MAG: hypothetical protein GWP91_09485 [Rhodobacterales bacterium]|nr:hypothetical protein [Rhodobacterales bacterium]